MTAFITVSAIHYLMEGNISTIRLAINPPVLVCWRIWNKYWEPDCTKYKSQSQLTHLLFYFPWRVTWFWFSESAGLHFYSFISSKDAYQPKQYNCSCHFFISAWYNFVRAFVHNTIMQPLLKYTSIILKVSCSAILAWPSCLTIPPLKLGKSLEGYW